jgi:hypothetical protein
VDETIGLMAIKPADLSARLKRLFRMEPVAAVEQLEALIEETVALVETHAPGFGTAPYRAHSAGRRVAFDTPPAPPGRSRSP